MQKFEISTTYSTKDDAIKQLSITTPGTYNISIQGFIDRNNISCSQKILEFKNNANGCEGPIVVVDSSLSNLVLQQIANIDSIKSISSLAGIDTKYIQQMAITTMSAIDANFMKDCNSLKTLMLPSDGSLLSIGSNAFQNCYSLTSIIIPDSVECIGENAFQNCENLMYCYIPSNTSIGNNAFQQKPIYCDELSLNSNTFSFANQTNITLKSNAGGYHDTNAIGFEYLSGFDGYVDATVWVYPNVTKSLNEVVDATKDVLNTMGKGLSTLYSFFSNKTQLSSPSKVEALQQSISNAMDKTKEFNARIMSKLPLWNSMLSRLYTGAIITISIPFGNNIKYVSKTIDEINEFFDSLNSDDKIKSEVEKSEQVENTKTSIQKQIEEMSNYLSSTYKDTIASTMTLLKTIPSATMKNVKLTKDKLMALDVDGALEIIEDHVLETCMNSFIAGVSLAGSFVNDTLNLLTGKIFNENAHQFISQLLASTKTLADDVVKKAKTAKNALKAFENPTISYRVLAIEQDGNGPIQLSGVEQDHKYIEEPDPEDPYKKHQRCIADDEEPVEWNDWVENASIEQHNLVYSSKTAISAYQSMCNAMNASMQVLNGDDGDIVSIANSKSLADKIKNFKNSKFASEAEKQYAAYEIKLSNAITPCENT